MKKKTAADATDWGRIPVKIPAGALILLLLFMPATLCPAEAPTGRVKKILEEAMAVQSGPDLQGRDSRETRKDAIKKIIAENFDLPAMAEASLDRHWEGLEVDQAAEFKEIFRHLFQDSYTRLVLDFLKDEEVLYTGETRDNDRTMVQTVIMRSNDELPVDYSLVQAKNGWLVNDVIIDGVSILGNYRRSFSRVIQVESYQSLLEKMRLRLKAIE